MIRTRAVQANFDRASGRYEAHAPLQQQWRRALLDETLPLLPATATVLDIGAGTGGMAAAAPEDWQMISLDLAPGMCREALAHGPAVQADANALPLASGSCDGVVSSLCLQWITPRGQAMAEMHRVLRAGGIAAIMTLGRATLQELRSLDALRLLPMDALAHYIDDAENAGFDVLSAESWLETHGYASLSALLRSFKMIGAQAVDQRARAMGPDSFAALQRRYAAQFPHAEGVTASWEPMLIMLRKRESV